MAEKTGLTITLRTSMNWEPQLFHERPAEPFEAILFDGETFPLQFLKPHQEVRVAQDDTGGVVVCEVDDTESWDLEKVKPGEWLVRAPGGKLTSYPAEEFAGKFQPAEEAPDA